LAGLAGAVLAGAVPGEAGLGAGLLRAGRRLAW
jgi:hypothetical protein